MRAKNASERRKPPPVGLNLDLSLSPIGDQFDRPPLSPLLTPLRLSGEDKSMDWEKIFGEDEKAIKRIVHDDCKEQAHKKRKGKAKAKVEPVLGVKFWEERSATDVDGASFTMPKLPQKDTVHPGYRLLSAFAAANDFNGIGLLLDCGDFTAKGFPLTSDVISWLVKIALSSNELLASKASSTILHLIEQGSLNAERYKAKITMRIFVESLLQLGVKTEVLQTLGIPEYQVPNVWPENRPVRVFRLVTLVGAFASVNMFDERQVANLAALLLGIAMDPSSDVDLQDYVKKTIENLCNVYCLQSDRNETELSICRQSLLLCSGLEIANKTYLMTFVPGGSSVAKRIAQWIAFGMLAGDTASDIAAESNDDLLPPLSAINAILSQQPNEVVSEEAARKFDLRRIGEDDEAEYDALSGNAELLSRVMSNIHLHVDLDKRRQAEASSVASEVKDVCASPSRSTVSAPKAPLDKIEVALKHMIGRIKDDSSQPERTRAKATIQRLVLRLSYQRNMGSGVSREVLRPKAPKKIDSFFKKAD